MEALKVDLFTTVQPQLTVPLDIKLCWALANGGDGRPRSIKRHYQ